MPLAEPTDTRTANAQQTSSRQVRLRHLRARLDEQPEAVELWRDLAELLADAPQDAEQAADAFSRAAHLHLRAGHLTAALSLFERAVQCGADRADDFLELGKTYHQLGRFRDAFDAYQRAYELAAVRDRSARPLGVLERMIRLKPEDVELQLERAHRLEAAGQTDQAIEAFRACAQAYERAGRTEEFLQVAEHLLEIGPGDAKLRSQVVEALLAETEVLMNFQLHDRAEEALERALGYAPSSTVVRERLVVLYERTRQPMKFIEAVGELARRVDGGPKRAASYLRRAANWVGAREDIEHLARSLEVDLSEPSDVNVPLPGESEGLGDQATAPRDESLPAFARESTRDHGMLFGGESRTKNLMGLLRAVERAQTPTRIILQDGDGAPYARLIAHDGRLEVGVEIDGEIFVDKALKRVSAELAERLRVEGPAGLSAADMTTGERSQLYRLTARALVYLAEVCEGHQFCLRACSHDADAQDTPSFAPFSLLIRAAGYMHSDSNVAAAAFYEQMCERSEEAWLMVQADPSTELCLPVRTTYAFPRTLKEVRQLGRAAHDMLAYARKVAEPMNAHAGLAPTFVFDDAMWCSFCCGDQVALVRTEPLQLGYVVARARALMQRALMQQEEGG